MNMTSDEQTRVKRARLEGTYLFAEVPEQALDQLARFAKLQSFGAKKVLFYKSDPGKQFYVIAEGRVQLSTVSAEAKELVIGILGEGEIFGELSMLDGKQRTATATTMEPCELIVVERRDFLPFLEMQPEVAIKLLSILALRLRMIDQLYEDNLMLPLPVRLAKQFLALASRYGYPVPNGVRLGLKLSQQEIGNLVSATRESVNKQMRRWQDEGIVEFSHGTTTLVDLTALQKVVREAATGG